MGFIHLGLPPNIGNKVRYVLESARNEGLRKIQKQVDGVKITIKRTSMLHVVKSEKVGRILWITKKKTKIKKDDIIAKIEYLRIIEEVFLHFQGSFRKFLFHPAIK